MSDHPLYGNDGRLNPSTQVRSQEQSMLLNEGRSCQRREFNVLPRGAQVRGSVWKDTAADET